MCGRISRPNNERAGDKRRQGGDRAVRGSNDPPAQRAGPDVVLLFRGDHADGARPSLFLERYDARTASRRSPGYRIAPFIAAIYLDENLAGAVRGTVAGGTNGCQTPTDLGWRIFANRPGAGSLATLGFNSPANGSGARLSDGMGLRILPESGGDRNQERPLK